MEIVYRSFDGKIFYKKDECLKYEKGLAFKMYGPNGLTNNADTCYVVDIKTPEAAGDFLKTCRTIGTYSDGIEDGFFGVYIWSANEKKYLLLEPLTRKALKEYFKDTETQE